MHENEIRSKKALCKTSVRMRDPVLQRSYLTNRKEFGYALKIKVVEEKKIYNCCVYQNLDYVARFREKSSATDPSAKIDRFFAKNTTRVLFDAWCKVLFFSSVHFGLIVLCREPSSCFFAVRSACSVKLFW